jgi:hypothetical protein
VAEEAHVHHRNRHDKKYVIQIHAQPQTQIEQQVEENHTEHQAIKARMQNIRDLQFIDIMPL